MQEVAKVSEARLMRRRKVLWLGLLLGVALYLSRTLWLPPIGAFLVVADPLTPAEMVLPLAGDLERVTTAAKLYQAGYARRLLLTNLPLPTQAARDAHLHQARAIATAGGVDEADIAVVPEIARTTFEEAQNVQVELERLKIHSLVVVTSPWHTRRARLGLRAAFRGSSVQVSVQPLSALAQGAPRAAYPAYSRSWWHGRSTRQATFSEYLKLAAYAVGIR